MSAGAGISSICCSSLASGGSWEAGRAELGTLQSLKKSLYPQTSADPPHLTPFLSLPAGNCASVASTPSSSVRPFSRRARNPFLLHSWKSQGPQRLTSFPKVPWQGGGKGGKGNEARATYSHLAGLLGTYHFTPTPRTWLQKFTDLQDTYYKARMGWLSSGVG